MTANQETYHVHAIGHVRCTDDGNYLEILEPYRLALKQLEHFSHVMVLWWAVLCDDDESRAVTQCNPPYAESVLTGIFATRSPARPNPIALSTCKLLSVDEKTGLVRIAEIDAIDDTPIVDLKAYFPVCDRVKDVRIPDWLSDWPDWMPDEGIGLDY